ncbi:unnamed protein product [Malus baccata var. baccata]
MEDDETEEGMLVEEDAASPPPPKKPEKSPPYEMLQESKSSVEDIVAKMIAIKKEAKPKSELRELVTQMFLNFVILRQANRSILLKEDRVKAETESAKAPVNLTTLQLHNLMYEKSHCVKAIKACKDFKSKYPDIELLPEEEFFRDAPANIKDPMLSNDASHDIMLKRLNFELHQRKELCKHHEKLEIHKKGLLETIANRKKFLSSLPSHLKSLKKVSLLHHSAELLPPALYVVYSQFMAQKEAFDEQIVLDVVWSVKDAQAFTHQQANKDTVKQNLEQSGLYQVHPLKIILHIYDDEVSDPKSAKLITLKFEFLLKLNVVCVGIEGSHDATENNILCNLFPDDIIEFYGLIFHSAKLLVGDVPAFDEKRISRPYKWAQHLAGIDFLPEVSPSLAAPEASICSYHDTTKNDAVISGLSLYRQQNRIQTVIESLPKLKWPSLSCESVPWALHTPLCKLHGFSSVGPPHNVASSLSVIDKEQSQEPMDVNLVRRSGPSKEEQESIREDGELPSLVPAASVVNENTLSHHKGANLDHSRRLYKIHDVDLDLFLDTESDLDEPTLVLEKENLASVESSGNSWVDFGVREYCVVLTQKINKEERNMKLEAKIKISIEYPLRPPFFALSLCTISGENHKESDEYECYNELRALEAEVNLHMVKMLPQSEENNILAHQVRCLAMLFDYYMDEASPSSEKRHNTSVVDVGLCKPVSGQVVAKSFRGRDRRKMIS